jgi:hypothetical protein
MMRSLFLILLLAGAGLLGGCASGDKKEDPDRVSTIPWNRPEKWESQGGLGGFMPGTQ